MDSNDADGVVLVDVLPMSIGVGLPGGRFKKIIERNTKLRTRRRWASPAPARTSLRSRSPSSRARARRRRRTSTSARCWSLDCPGGRAGRRSTRSCSRSPRIHPDRHREGQEERSIGRGNFSTKDTPEEVRKRLADAPVTDTRAVRSRMAACSAGSSASSAERKHDLVPVGCGGGRWPIQSAVDPLQGMGGVLTGKPRLRLYARRMLRKTKYSTVSPAMAAKMAIWACADQPQTLFSMLCLRPHQPR